jgi:alkylation response protein AidB-like acyl-CoA dehydrogenase
MVNTQDGLVLDGAAILAKATEVGPLLREHSAEVEAARRLTGPVVEALRSTGVFRMSMPRAWGGPEVDPLRQIEIIETLSRADASAGWCAMINSDSGFFAAHLEDACARALYSELDSATAGWVVPTGTLEVCDGGYRLSGRWTFGSGSTHADVIYGGAHVTENGVPRMTADGIPEWRIAMLPASRWEVLETWDTTGLAGSGSHDFTIADAFVPAANTWVLGQPKRTELLYSWRGMFVVNFVGVPLGIALDACDTASSLLKEKILMPEMIAAAESPQVRAAIARARAMVGSARSYAYDIVGGLWATLEAGDQPGFGQRAELAGCLVHATSTCRDAVELLVDTVGTAAIRKVSPLERQMRDLNTIKQHILGQNRMWEWAGGLYFGDNSPLPQL